MGEESSAGFKKARLQAGFKGTFPFTEGRCAVEFNHHLNQGGVYETS